VWGGLALFGCGQELVLPTGAGGREQEQDMVAESGETGTAGAPDVAAEPQAPLPLPDSPIYTTFGGAGGEQQGGQGGAEAALEPLPPVSGGTAGTSMPPSAEGGAGGDASPPTADPVPVLLFTEYVEGSGSLKALEIMSLNSASLEGCELRTHFNGKLEPTRLALHGSLEAGGLYVLCSSTLATAQPALCDRSTNLTFNGDDALALACGGRVLDVIGQVGFDPGETWGEGATADHTLRRRCEVTAGREDGSQPFDPAVEWEMLASDVFDDLGQRSCP
jgi:hypothetical protein